MKDTVSSMESNKISFDKFSGEEVGINITLLIPCFCYINEKCNCKLKIFVK